MSHGLIAHGKRTGADLIERHEAVLETIARLFNHLVALGIIFENYELPRRVTEHVAFYPQCSRKPRFVSMRHLVLDVEPPYCSIC